MKKLLTILLGLSLTTSAFAYTNLWEYYTDTVGYLPSVAERAVTALENGIDGYTGTAEQNTNLLQALSGEMRLSGFRPSGYTGKLLTRLTEGGAESTFNTTPGTAPDGTSLTTAKMGDFIVITVNPGAANEEKISASAVSVSGTTATWTIINRGLSFTENVAVTANKKQHAIGETVIISNDDHYLNTQYPAKDEDATITGQWTFDVFPITPDSPAASETTAGIVELATGAEAASSTSSGTQGRLTLPASIATSTYNSATAALKVVVTGNDGKINNNFIATSTLFANPTFTGTTTIANLSPIVRATTTTGVWTKPAGLKYVVVEVQAAGGNGGAASAGSSASSAGGGGGGGGYSRKTIAAASLGATETVTIGAVGSPSSFGSHLSASSGANGVDEGAGGSGGVGSDGDINIEGQDGGAGKVESTTRNWVGATGGSSHLGGGGQGGPSTAGNGFNGNNYGGGGGGASSDNNTGATSGGTGAPGIVIITEYYL